MHDWKTDLLWNAIGYGVVAGAALIALVGLFFFVPALRGRWLPILRLRPSTWTGHDVFLAFCVINGFPVLIVMALLHVGFFVPLIGPTPDLEPNNETSTLYLLRCSVISSPLVLAVILGILFTMMFARAQSRPHHYGLTWSRWPVNLALGIAAFVLVRPIVIGIYALATLLYGTDENPFEALSNQQLPSWEWALLAFQVTVQAPFMEEIFFRGIFQDWLRRAALIGHIVVIVTAVLWVGYDLVEFDMEQKAFGLKEAKVWPVLFTVVLAVGYGFAMFRLARRYRLKEDEIYNWRPEPSPPSLDTALAATEEQAREARRQMFERDETRARDWAEANARLAIFGSAYLFAVIHSMWPAPVALFPMGLVLGWLSRRTQSLVAPITFHLLFNLATFIALYGMVLSGSDKKGNEQTTAPRPSVVGSMTSSVPGSQLPLRK